LRLWGHRERHDVHRRKFRVSFQEMRVEPRLKVWVGVKWVKD
jgi:hypothetical protein